MAARATTDTSVLDDRLDGTQSSAWGGLISFLAAGAVLSASLIVGSAVSMAFAGGNDLIAAILEGFLELGLWAFGGFLAAVALAAALTRRRG